MAPHTPSDRVYQAPRGPRLNTRKPTVKDIISNDDELLWDAEGGIEAKIQNEADVDDLARRKRNLSKREIKQHMKKRKLQIAKKTKAYHSSSEEESEDEQSEEEEQMEKEVDGDNEDADGNDGVDSIDSEGDSGDDDGDLASDAESFMDKEFDDLDELEAMELEENEGEKSASKDKTDPASKEESLKIRHAKMSNAIARLLGNPAAGEKRPEETTPVTENTNESAEKKAIEQDTPKEKKPAKVKKSGPVSQNPILSRQKHIERQLDNAILEAKAKIVLKQDKKQKELETDHRIDYATIQKEQRDLIREEFNSRSLKISGLESERLLTTKSLQTPKEIEHERALRKVATRGVVKLFNAIRSAQTVVEEVDTIRTKKAEVAKLTKQSFLEVLRKDESSESSKDKKVADSSQKPATESTSAVSWMKDDFNMKAPKHWDDANEKEDEMNEEEEEESEEEEEFE